MQWLRTVPGEVLTSLVAAGILVLIGMLFRSVRNFVLYQLHEYEFEYDSDFQGCEWDVQWEGARVTIVVKDVHNEHLERVTIKKNGENPGQHYDVLRVSDRFHAVGDLPMQIKLSSIVRTKPGTGVREYTVFFVIRRRRW